MILCNTLRLEQTGDTMDFSMWTDYFGLNSKLKASMAAGVLPTRVRGGTRHFYPRLPNIESRETQGLLIRMPMSIKDTESWAPLPQEFPGQMPTTGAELVPVHIQMARSSVPPVPTKQPQIQTRPVPKREDVSEKTSCGPQDNETLQTHGLSSQTLTKVAANAPKRVGKKQKRCQVPPAGASVPNVWDPSPATPSRWDLELSQCSFCKANGESQRVYTAHGLKDQLGNVVCPILSNYTCPQCKATGAKAHTRRFCPMTNKRYTSVYQTPSSNADDKKSV
ncbi:nanos homolog 3 [Mixophyes fleayi]|uniref:nanos homolog 3 n=1 Tax=Mixophyes fleayi TaxID=3061075 RepID=UPI003F4E25BD